MPQDFSSYFGPQKTEKPRSAFGSYFGTEPETSLEEESLVSKTISKVAGVIPEPVKNTVSTVLDVLGRPGAATAGLVAGALDDGPGLSDLITGQERPGPLKRAWQNLTGERRDDFDQVLEEQGFEDGIARNVAGFVGDVVIDPLNLVGVGAVKNLATRGAQAVGKGVTAVTPQAVKGVVKGVADDLGGKFVPRYGTTLQERDLEALKATGRDITNPEQFREELRMFQKERSTIPTRVEKDIIERYKGTTPEFRNDVLEGMDAGAGRTAEVDEMVLKQTSLNDKLFQKEVDAGVMKETSYRPDYAPADYSRSKGPTASAKTNPHSALNARNKFAKARQDKEMTIAEHIEKGAEPDVALAQLTREIEGNRAALSGEFLQKMVREYGIPAKYGAPDDWQVLKNIPQEKVIGKITSEIAFPSYIAKELDKLYAPAAKPGMLGKLYDKTLQMWRTQATVLRPGFHSTNLQGNLFNGAYLAGALHPARYLEAATWDRLKRAGLESAPNIGRYSAKEVDEFMERFGVGGAGHSFTSELMEEGADKTLIAKLEGKNIDRNPLKHPIRFGKHVGQTIEDFSKRALFFDQLHKGKSLEEAAQTVDKYLFDYADLTDFERKVARRVFPFYTWMRKNVPLQAEQLVKQPHKYAAVGKTKNAIEGAAEDEGVFTPEAERPEYVQQQNAVQLPTEKGEPKQYWTPYLPYQDLNKLPIPGGSNPLDAIREILSGIEPLSKNTFELAANKSLFFDRQLYDKDLGAMGDTQRLPASLEMLPDALKRVLFNEVATKGGGAQFEIPFLLRHIAQQSPLGEAVGRAATSLSSPEEVSNPQNWLSPVAGVRITQRSQEQENEDRKRARTDAKRTATKRKNQDKRPPAPKGSKVKSLYERYSQE